MSLGKEKTRSEQQKEAEEYLRKYSLEMAFNYGGSVPFDKTLQRAEKIFKYIKEGKTG